MHKDIVETLRNWPCRGSEGCAFEGCICAEGWAAADEIERLRAALRWALPLAASALETTRQERLLHGHNDIQGTYKSGVTWVGIHQSEVDALEEARAALAKAEDKRHPRSE